MLLLDNLQTAVENSEQMCTNIVESIISKTFNYFMWTNHMNVLLPAKGSVKVPVVFNRCLTNLSVSEYYTITFDNTEYSIPNLVKH